MGDEGLGDEAVILAASKPASGVWSDLDPGDRHLWDHLAEHLAGAGLPVGPVVTEPAWVVRRIAEFGVGALERDLQVAIAHDDGPSFESHELFRRLGLFGHLIPSSDYDDVARTYVLWFGGDPGRGVELDGPPVFASQPWAMLQRTTALRRVLKGHSGWVPSVTWSPDGTRVATAGDDGRILVSDAASAKTRWQGHGS